MLPRWSQVQQELHERSVVCSCQWWKKKEKSQYNRIQQTKEMSHNSTAGSILLEQENRAVQGRQCFFRVYVPFLHSSKNRLAMELSGSSRDWTGVKVPGVCDFNSGKPSESRNVDGVIDKTVIYTRQDGNAYHDGTVPHPGKNFEIKRWKPESDLERRGCIPLWI